LSAFWLYLKEALAGGGLTPGSLTEEELTAVKELRREKYDTWEWTFGRSPRYSMTNRRRWDGGSLEPHLEVEKGCITGIVFYGDFLSLCSLEPVTEALLGCPFRREEVAAVLDRCPLPQYFGGITREEILDTLFHPADQDE
jgi:lipoate-protein ligase A